MKEEYKEGSAGMSDVIEFLVYLTSIILIAVGVWNVITDTVIVGRHPTRIKGMPGATYAVDGKSMLFVGVIILAIALLFRILKRREKE